MKTFKQLIALMVICFVPSVAFSETLKVGIKGEPSYFTIEMVQEK